MKTIDKSPEVLARLQSFETFRGLPPEPLRWFIDRSDYLLYERGDLLFSPGAKVDHLQVIVQGRYLIEMEQEGEPRELGVCKTGYITGVLPHGGSRGLRAGAGGLLRAGTAPGLLLGTGTDHRDIRPCRLLQVGGNIHGMLRVPVYPAYTAGGKNPDARHRCNDHSGGYRSRAICFSKAP